MLPDFKVYSVSNYSHQKMLSKRNERSEDSYIGPGGFFFRKKS